MAVVNPMQLELRKIEFSNSLLLMLENNDSGLRGAVQTAMNGNSRTTSPANYIAPRRYRAAGPRGSMIEPEYSQYQRRWVDPADYRLTDWQDEFDLLRTPIDPTSAIMQVFEEAGTTLFDDVIMAAFFGTAKIGEDPTNQTTETYNSGSNFPVSVHVDETFGAGVATGMTVAKIIEAKRIMSKYVGTGFDRLQLHMGMTSQAEADLMKSAEFTSTEYRNSATYDQVGRTTSFMGVQFHYSERWPYDPADSDERWLPMWSKEKGMHLEIWSDISPNISKETLIESQPMQIYSRVTIGATRLLPGRVIRIGVLDTTGGAVLG